MKTNFLLGGLCAICMITFTVASVISCSGDDEYYEGGNYTLAKKRMTRGTPENPMQDGPREFLNYSNCGLWGVAQMMGDADNASYQNMVMSAAESSIGWNEDENMSNLQNGANVRSLSGEDLLSVCKKIEEDNSKKQGISSSNIGRLPNAYEKNPSVARTMLSEMVENAGYNRKVSGVLVGVETYVDGQRIQHWVSLDYFKKNGDLLVRDALTREKYEDRERRGIGNESDRYKQTYGLSSVYAILYRK